LFCFNYVTEEKNISYTIPNYFKNVGKIFKIFLKIYFLTCTALAFQLSYKWICAFYAKFKNLAIIFSILIHTKENLSDEKLRSIIMKNIFLHIVMKVALFYTKNRGESSSFLHHFIPSLWRWLSKHSYFFFVIFHKSF
jgi:hypothetical protein